MFHHTQLLNAQRRILKDLEHIEDLGSVKLYLCYYDDLLVSQEEYNGLYPCSNKKVSLYEVLAIINLVFKKPCIVRHNVIISPFPAGLTQNFENQPELEKWVEVCLIQNL
jgi:hypothetical protein